MPLPGSTEEELSLGYSPPRGGGGGVELPQERFRVVTLAVKKLLREQPSRSQSSSV